MGRREEPLDPAQGPVQHFAFELRKLRQEAGGITYGSMARCTKFSVTALSRAAAGKQLPSLPVALAYVAACGGDTQEWERRWRTAAEESAAAAAVADDSDPPYQGLARFEPGDHERYFGRERLAGEVLALMRARRFSAVFGPSGSGKSSLLRAGLIPALQTEPSPQLRPAGVRILTPGPHPARTHSRVFTPKDGPGETVVIIDQFEEVFTLCADPAERSTFIDLALTASQTTSRLRVVLAVRADFYGRCAEHDGLARSLGEASILVGPMNPAELREAIVKPATAHGLIVERALTTKIVDEVVGEPGGLPMMSHALLETWRRRRGRILNEAAYDAAGGIRGAIARTAEDVYTAFTPAQAELARRILLRLVTPGEGAQDTRRPSPRDELDTGQPDTTAVLERLARARLVILDEDTVDLAHEALITAWPRFQAWIDANREVLRIHRRLTEAARSWDELHRDPGSLYRGNRLTAACEVFAPGNRESLTLPEAAFLDASTAARDHERQAAARATRRLRALTATLSVLLVLAVSAGTLAWKQSRTSEQQRQVADRAQQVAVSRQLAAQSEELMGTDPELASLLAVRAYQASPTSEATASLYTAAASPLERRLSGHSARVGAVAFSPDGHTLATASDDHTVRLWDTATGRTRTTLTGHKDSVASVAFSPDGRTVATGSADHTVRLWDAITGRTVRIWRTANSRTGTRISTILPFVTPVQFSPDGRTLATASDDGTVQLRDTATGRTRTTLTGHKDSVESVAFSPDGRTVATGSETATIRIWDAATGRPGPTFTDPSASYVSSLVFSHNGRTLANVGNGDTVRLWDTATGRSQTTLPRQANAVESVAFSPDGRTVATASGDHIVRLWDAATARTRTTLPRGTDIDYPESAAFSPDGRTLATGSSDGIVRLWDTTAGQPDTTLTAPDPFSATFSRDGRTLATGSDGTVHLWDLATGTLQATLAGHGSLDSVAFRPQPRMVAVADSHGTVLLWDTATGRTRTTRTGHGGDEGWARLSPDGRTLLTSSPLPTRPGRGIHLPAMLQLWDVASGRPGPAFRTADRPMVAFSPDGHTLAIRDGALRLWNTSTGRLRITLDNLTDAVSSVAFSPDGRTLATGSADGAVHLWDLSTGQLHATLVGHTDTVSSVAFSPDGRTLATGDLDGTVRLWSVATGRTRTTFTNPGSVSSVEFNPDGHTVATMIDDPRRGGSIRLWNVALLDQAAAISKICRAVHRDLTAQERSVYLPGQPPSPVCHL